MPSLEASPRRLSARRRVPSLPFADRGGDARSGVCRKKRSLRPEGLSGRRAQEARRGGRAYYLRWWVAGGRDGQAFGGLGLVICGLSQLQQSPAAAALQGDPCCGDPCCGDPCCGDPCWEIRAAGTRAAEIRAAGTPAAGPVLGDPSCLQSSGGSSSSVVEKALRPAGASSLPAALEKCAGGAARGQCVMNGNRGF